MRPVRLELQGFTAFRDATVVDFVGADLFALTGPTGAGKSSIIDAMTFALYGIVARYDDRRLVAPVITQGTLEARVRFDFEVAGESYAAVRVVRSTSQGRATTKEARLERLADGEVLAGDAKSLSTQVETLLGLSYEHFTTCVVLPQGEFDRFLHEERADREKLLERLLALRQFRDMAGQARSRAAADQARLEIVDAQLAELTQRGPGAVASLEGRLVKLRRLADRIAEAKPVIEKLRIAGEEARRDASRFEAQLTELRRVQVPEAVLASAERLATLDRELFLQTNQTEAAVILRTELEARSPELEERTELGRVVERRRKQVEIEERLVKGTDVVEQASKANGAAEARRDGAQAELSSAEKALDEARRADQAQEVRAQLVDGEPCPVCLQDVHEIPVHEPSSTVTEAQTRRTEAARVLEDASRESADTGQAMTKAELQFSTLTDELAELSDVLDGAPSGEAAERRLAELGRLAGDLESARSAAAEAEKQNRLAQQRRAALVDQQSTLRQAFDDVRAPLSELDPPPSDHVDLAADWIALSAWAEDQAPVLDRARASVLTAGTEADDERKEIERRIVATCTEMDLEVGAAAPAEAVAAAIATTESGLAQARRDAERADVLDREHAALGASQRTAEKLGRHLFAGQFTTWLLDEALVSLVAGATVILHQLTDGAYSLAMDEDGARFAVVDHSNANAVRAARTLSGGETFLASLALALALAEQVADLAGDGAPPLESVFLDEGFGALDTDTLDVVAAALEELGASGRMVGVVTHVRELAERLPTRFEVRKGPHTATVERVER